jgi:CheY-like chemotaxis protein
MANETVLVIEDNEMNMKLVRSLLQLGKYSVLEAIDAENGIQLAREHHPDLILMDIQLPGMDGLTATREIKKDPAVKDITVVALTSYAMQGDEEKARDAGCAGYISKPIDTRSFLETVDQFFV